MATGGAPSRSRIGEVPSGDEALAVCLEELWRDLVPPRAALRLRERDTV